MHRSREVQGNGFSKNRTKNLCNVWCVCVCLCEDCWINWLIVRLIGLLVGLLNTDCSPHTQGEHACWHIRFVLLCVKLATQRAALWARKHESCMKWHVRRHTIAYNNWSMCWCLALQLVWWVLTQSGICIITPSWVHGPCWSHGRMQAPNTLHQKHIDHHTHTQPHARMHMVYWTWCPLHNSTHRNDYRVDSTPSEIRTETTHLFSNDILMFSERTEKLCLTIHEISENQWNYMQIYEHLWEASKSMRISENLWTPMNINNYRWKELKYIENRSKFMKLYGDPTSPNVQEQHYKMHTFKVNKSTYKRMNINKST